MKVVSENIFMVFDQYHPNIVNSSYNIKSTPGLPLSTQEGHVVKSYKELLLKIAQLSFYNSRYKLLFRGQNIDYKISKRSNRSNLFPSIFRTKSGDFGILRQFELDDKFSTLHQAEKLLNESFQFGELNNQIVNWAILQHYEICDTPLLDITTSLQTALSFAIGNGNEGYLYVLAFPLLSGPISVSIESNSVIVDLSQIMNPDVLRPHFQNAMLVGDYPLINKREYSHGKRGLIGNNFSCRLLTKFKLIDCKNWILEGFKPTSMDILFPDEIDICSKTMLELKSQL